MQQHEQDTLAANLEAVCGPEAEYSEHKKGETVTYHVSPSEIRTGVILRVDPPQMVLGQHIPLCYQIDSGHGFPDLAYATDIMETPFSD